MPDSTSEDRREHIGAEESPIQINRFQKLEHQLATIWGGNSGKKKLLFAGSEIKFQPSSGMESVFIIERSEKSSHLIFFEEEIILRCIGEGDNTNQKERILPFTKDGSVRKRPVVSGEQLILQFGSNRKMLPGIVEVIQVSENALHDWIKPLVPKNLLNVAQNIVFLCFLMSNGILEQMKSFGQPVIDKLLIKERNSIGEQLLLAFLMSDETLDQVKNFDISDMKNFLTSCSLDIILAELESVKEDLSPELQDSYLQWKILTLIRP
jgi:hypothetical protein